MTHTTTSPVLPERLAGLLGHAVSAGASDLHLASESSPWIRVDGQLTPLEVEPLDAEQVAGLARALMTPEQRAVFAREHVLDLALGHAGVRWRANVFRERGRVAVALRRLDEVFRSLEELSLPAAVGRLADIDHGLVLVCGPTGSGKTTTLATLLHAINLTRTAHIITIEDPVEYLHASARCLVQQRELHVDVTGFADGLRAALREDPDVLLIGEMRDAETARAAIMAAETGHLVFSSLHTGDAVGAIDRIVALFGAGEQESVRAQLSLVLRAVVAQRLLPAAHGSGRVPAVELLTVSSAVANLVRTGRASMIRSAMETGGSLGMITAEQSLAELAASGRVGEADARALAHDTSAFDRRLQLARATAGAPS